MIEFSSVVLKNFIGKGKVLRIVAEFSVNIFVIVQNKFYIYRLIMLI